MAKQLQLRRGTTTQHNSFAGVVGEVTVDTDKDVVVVHTGGGAGTGVPMAKYPASAGTVAASELAQVDANQDITGFRNITLTGELDAATGDFSGNVDIDGTCEADAYTVDGTALNEYIADTVGGMVGSNTETGISVTYDDSDNTLDFVVGTLNQDTTGTAAIATSVTVADESTDTTCFPTFVTAATGNLGAKSDSQLTYNSNTGALGATTFVGNVDAVDIDVDGTANLDAVDIDGDVDLAGDLTFSAAKDIKLLDNTAAALDITEASNSYIKFDTTNGDELITVSKACAGAVSTIGTTTGTITVDFADGNNQKVTLTGNPTFGEPSNQVAGQSGSIFIIQDAGGSNVVQSWHADWKFAGGTDAVLSTAGNSVDRLDYIILADNSVHAVLSADVK